jgi:hypothetical protein
LKAADENGNPQACSPNLASEWNLLLTACSVLPSSEKHARIRVATQIPIQWNALFHLAEQHGVTCLLRQALSTLDELVPPAEMRRLDQRYQTNLHKVLLSAGELIRIIDGLDSLAIEAMPYKGLALAETLYGDIAARQSGDIDLLIHVRDLARVKQVVHDLGYSTNWKLSKREEQAYLISGYEYAFDGTAGKNLLEVQWALQPRFYAVDFDLDEMFRRAASVTVAGREMKTPSPQDLVLVLSVHAAKHMWTRLIWICDIARLLELPGLHWNWIARQARTLGVSRILHVTILLAHRLLNASLPVAIKHEILKDHTAQAWSQSIGKKMIEGNTIDFESWHYFRSMMRLRERPSDQARFLWRLASTPGRSEWQSIRLPEPLFPLYRLVRLSRLAARLFRI